MHAQTAVGHLLSTISVVSQDLVPVSDVPKLNLGLPILGVLGTQVTVLVIAIRTHAKSKQESMPRETTCGASAQALFLAVVFPTF
jgi:hypothetical protein